jgi:hypothetical protein
MRFLSRYGCREFEWIECLEAISKPRIQIMGNHHLTGLQTVKWVLKWLLFIDQILGTFYIGQSL